MAKIFSSGQPVSSYEYIEIFVKKGVTRRDLGNRASPVDRAYTLSPSKTPSWTKPGKIYGVAIIEIEQQHAEKRNLWNLRILRNLLK